MPAFDESAHPRVQSGADGGEFTAAGGGGSGAGGTPQEQAAAMAGMTPQEKANYLASMNPAEYKAFVAYAGSAKLDAGTTAALAKERGNRQFVAAAEKNNPVTAKKKPGAKGGGKGGGGAAKKPAGKGGGGGAAKKPAAKKSGGGSSGGKSSGGKSGGSSGSKKPAAKPAAKKPASKAPTTAQLSAMTPAKLHQEITGMSSADLNSVASSSKGSVHDAAAAELKRRNTTKAAQVAIVNDVLTAIAKAQGVDLEKSVGSIERLDRYWTEGEGRARIGWGSPGDFARCQTQMRVHGVPGHEIDGHCARLHHRATGAWPGHAPGEHAGNGGH